MNRDQAYEFLENSWKSNRFAQAYIVVGGVRTQGLLLTEQVLRLVLCPQEDAPCGECPACRQIGTHTHPDVLWIEPQKRSRIISVDQMRATRSRMFQTSFIGGWKASVIMSADRLGPEAANAFLKTLEEPPPKSVFFLLTDSPQFLLSTIISRCQIVTLAGEEPRLAEALEDELVDVLTDRRAGGAVGAFSRADRVGAILKVLKSDAQEAVAKESEEDESTAAEKEVLDARANALFREQRTCLMRSLLFWQRDILLLASGGDDTLVYFDRFIDVLKERAGTISQPHALENIRIVEDMNRQLERNISESAVLGFGFTRLR